MNITITGSLGNVSLPLAEHLISEGHQLTIISSDHSKVAVINQLGVKAAIGNLVDADFLTHAFKDADAVFAMAPTNMPPVQFKQSFN